MSKEIKNNMIKYHKMAGHQFDLSKGSDQLSACRSINLPQIINQVSIIIVQNESYFLDCSSFHALLGLFEKNIQNHQAQRFSQGGAFHLSYQNGPGSRVCSS